MYGLYNIDDQKKYILSQAEALRSAAGSISKVKEVIKDFDGKIYNCRFDKAIGALTDETSRFYVSDHYGWIDIYHAPRHGGYNESKSILTGYSCKGSDQIKDKTRPEYILFNEKRIIASAMIDGLNTKREKLLQEAFTLETAAANLETTLAKISEAKNILNTMIKSLPAVVIDACNIKTIY